MGKSIEQIKIAIVGAGPAGVRAAEVLVRNGIRPMVFDEGSRDGGQVYRRQPENFSRSYEKLYGSEADKALALHQTFASLKSNIDYHPETLVWNIADKHVYTQSPKGKSKFEFDALLLCTGATDRLLPIKGWHYSGNFSLGGSQVALKSQACSIGKEVVFIGTGPLLYLVSYQYMNAGANVAAVIDTSSFADRLKALPLLLKQPKALYQGVKMTYALLKAKVPLFNHATPKEIIGSDENGVSEIRFIDKSGKERSIQCDAIAMGYHLRPETQLADLARCQFEFNSDVEQWLPVNDGQGRSSQPDIYLAGDGAEILGAHAAEISGELAALSALTDLKVLQDESTKVQLIKQMHSLKIFTKGLRIAFPWPRRLIKTLSHDTILCRCEGVTVGHVLDTIDITGADEANRVKSFSRVGMGRCQGRFCAHAGAELVAHHFNIAVEKAGRLRGQAPVKPVTVIDAGAKQ